MNIGRILFGPRAPVCECGGPSMRSCPIHHGNGLASCGCGFGCLCTTCPWCALKTFPYEVKE